MYKGPNKSLYFGWILIFLLHLISVCFEYYYITLQKSMIELTTDSNDSFNYRIQFIFSQFFSKILEILFMLFLFVFTDFIRNNIRTDYEYVFIILISKWIFFEIPSEIVSNNVEMAYKFTTVTKSELFRTEILKEIATIIIAFITVLMNHLISSIINLFLKFFNKHQENKENEINTLHSRDQQRGNPFIIFLICYSASIFMYFCIYKKFTTKKEESNLTETTIKIKYIIEWIRITQKINLSEILKLKKPVKEINRMYVHHGLFHKNLFIPSDALHFLNPTQLIAIIMTNYYILSSNEKKYIYFTFLLEILLYPLLVFIYYRGVKLSIKYFFSLHGGKTIACFYCIHWCFDIIRAIIFKSIVYDSDEITASKGLAIADALVKMSFINKETITHSHLYSFLNSFEPSLQDRLVNLAVSNSQYIID